MKSAVWAIVLVIIFLTPGPSFAKKLELHPSISLEEKYTDNLFLTADDEEDDFITTITPRLLLSYKPHRTFSLDLNYGLNFRFYSRHSDLNDTSPSHSQSAIFQNNIRPSKYFFIDVSDVYRRVPIDRRENTVIDNPVTNMTDSNVFRVSPYILYPITPTLKTRFGYSFTNKWYDADEGNNSSSHSAFASLIKDFSFGLTPSLNYRFVAFRGEGTDDNFLGAEVTDDDYHSHTGSVRAEYRSARDFSVWGEVGISELDFKNAPDETVNFWNAGTNYTFRFSKSTSLGAAYQQSFSESEDLYDVARWWGTIYELSDEGLPGAFVCVGCYKTYDKTSIITGATEHRRADLYFRAGTVVKLFINPYYMIEEELQTKREDRIKGISALLTRYFGKGLTVSLRGEYARSEYLPEDEKNSTYTGRLYANYRLTQRLNAFTGYSYNIKSSNINNDEYTNNIAWVGAKYSF